MNMRKLQVNLFFIFIFLAEVFFAFPVYVLVNRLFFGSSPLLFPLLASLLLIALSHYSFRFIVNKYSESRTRKIFIFFVFLPVIAISAAATFYLYELKLLITSLAYYLYICYRGFEIPKFRVKYHDFKGTLIRKTCIVIASWMLAYSNNLGEWYLLFSSPYTLIFFAASLTLLVQHRVMGKYEDDLNYISEKKSKELFGITSYLVTALFGLVVFLGYSTLFEVLSRMLGIIKSAASGIYNTLFNLAIGPLGLLVEAIFNSLILLIRLVSEDSQVEINMSNLSNEFAVHLESGGGNIQPYVNIALTAACIIIGFFMIWKYIEYLSRKKYVALVGLPVQETREFVAADGLKGMKNTFKNFFRKKKQPPPENLARRAFFEILKKVKSRNNSDTAAGIIQRYNHEISDRNREHLLLFSPVYYDVRYGNKPLKENDVLMLKRLLSRIHSHR